jgi:hypothetical protein
LKRKSRSSRRAQSGQKEGLKQQAMTGFGTPQRWPAENIWQSVAPHLPGFSVEILP